jgi:hypothetical protein
VECARTGLVFCVAERWRLEGSGLAAFVRSEDCRCGGALEPSRDFPWMGSKVFRFHQFEVHSAKYYLKKINASGVSAPVLRRLHSLPSGSSTPIQGGIRSASAAVGDAPTWLSAAMT